MKIKAQSLTVGTMFNMSGAGWLIAKTVVVRTQSNGKEVVDVYGEYENNKCSNTYRSSTQITVK